MSVASPGFIVPLIYFLLFAILHLEIIREACLVILKYKWNLNSSLRKGFLVKHVGWADTAQEIIYTAFA